MINNFMDLLLWIIVGAMAVLLLTHAQGASQLGGTFFQWFYNQTALLTGNQQGPKQLYQAAA